MKRSCRCSMLLLGLVAGCEVTRNVGDSWQALCSESQPCPNDQTCFSGTCTHTCNSDQECETGQYCDTQHDQLCHPTTVATCPQTPCVGNQACVNGFCSTASSTTTCTQMPDGSDTCDRYSVCVADVTTDSQQTFCYTFPACSAQGECPTGLIGALCNNGILPNKAQICLPGLCQTANNCPAQWHCIKSNTVSVIGFCEDGSLGSLCNTVTDCLSGLYCVGATAYSTGVCAPQEK